MTQINQHIYGTTIPLTDTIPLNVYLVKGSKTAVFIDSGIKSMHHDLISQMDEAGVNASDLSYVLNTHSHHDHIGGNGQMIDKTNCKIVAPEACAHWHNDWEAHFSEFARPFPDIFKDTPELREEVFGILDRPHKVDAFCKEGDIFDLGGGVQLECFTFSGHMPEEVGWLETKSNTLILGDVITLIDAPLIHGHLTVKGYRESLDKLEGVIKTRNVEQVLLAHFPPMSPSESFDLIEKARKYITSIEEVVIDLLKQQDQDLETLWRSACNRMNKLHEFRSLSTVNAHLNDLEEKRIVSRSNGVASFVG